MPRNEKKKLRVEIANVEAAWQTWTSLFGWDTWRQADEILRTKGSALFGYYDKMVDTDGVLAGVIETRIDAVAGLEWEVIPVSDEEPDQLLAEFVRFSLKRIHHLHLDLSQLLGACRNGFSITEVVWEDATWEGKAVLVPRTLVSKPPDWFRFSEGRELLFRTKDHPQDGEDVQPFKFIHHPFRPRYENPYGTSLLRSTYWPWWFKHHGMGEWIKAVERGAVGTVVIKYPSEATEEEIAEFGAAAERLLKSKWMAIRDTCEIEFPEIKIDPSFADTLIARCNTEMIYRVLGATHSSGTEGETGSRALGQVHNLRFDERKEADSQALAATINDQLVRWIVDLNFGLVEQRPIWKQRYERPRDLKQAGESLKTAAQLGVPISVRTAAEMLELPLAEEGDELIKAPQQPGIMPGGSDNGAGKDEEEDEKDESPPDEPEESEEEKEGESAERAVGGIVRTATRDLLARHEENFRTMEKLHEGAVEYGTPRYDAMADQVREWLAQFDTVEDAIDKADEFEIDPANFADCLLDIRFFALLHGAFGLFDDPRVRKALGVDALTGSGWIAFWQKVRELYERFVGRKWIPVPPEQAIALFEDRQVLERAEFDLLEAASRRQALTAAEMSAETIAGRLRPALQRALEEGVLLDDFISEVGNIVMSPAHAENIFRTNVVGAYNSGHAEALYYPPLARAIPAFQFMAIVDDRTTDICQERNGQVYTREDMTQVDIVPPCHYMCRSSIVGVFADEWDGSSASAPTEPAQQGFGRWSPTLGG